MRGIPVHLVPPLGPLPLVLLGWHVHGYQMYSYCHGFLIIEGVNVNSRMNDAGRRYAVFLCAALLLPVAAQGQSWVGNGPNAKNIRALTQSPANSSILWAGAFGWGVYKSTDGGGSWLNDRTGLTNAHVRSLLALSNTLVFAGTNDGVFKTTNGGSTWNASLATLNSVRSLAYDSSTGALFAATYGSGLYRSTDLGSSWAPLSVTDPTSGQTLSRQRAVAVFGPNSIYVGGSIGDIDSGGALFKSVNGGNSWAQVQTGTGVRSTIKSIAISPVSPATTLLFGTAANGVYRSTNAGATWVSIDAFTTPNPLRDQHVDAVAFSAASYYAGTDSTGRLYYRTAGDTSVGWLIGSGTPGAPSVPNAIAVDRAAPSTLYAGLEGQGVFKSLNAGASWQAINTGVMGTAARVIRVNGNGAIILGTEFGDGIWISNDQAASWTQAESLGTSNSITALTTTSNSSLLYAAAYGTGVYKSTNGGAWWTITDSTVLNHFLRALCVFPSNNNVVYAGTGNGVYRTIDGGANWSSIGVGIPAHTSIRCMTMDRTTPTTIYAGSDSSFLYRTTNGGSTWTHVTSANGFLPQDGFIRCITIDRTNAAVVLAGSDSGRVYRSTNSGTSWTLLSKIATVNSVRSILQSPNNANVVFAATFGSGIFVSADGGVHWAPLNTGLPDTEIFTLESDQANPVHIYAGTGSHGVFRLTYSYGNYPPVLAPTGNKSVPVGQTLSFTVSATDPEGTTPVFTVQGLQPGAAFVDSGNGRGRFTWTPTAGQIGVSALTIIASDLVLADTESVSIAVLDSSGNMVVNVPLDGGWNLVSVPVTAVDNRATVLFPGATSAAFAYSGGYSQRDTLVPGAGYWLKYSAAQNVSFTGAPVAAETVAVVAGWNLVGSLSSTVAASMVTAIPPAAILSPFYGFTPGGGYAPAASIVPGRASWVKVSQDGLLVIGVGTPVSARPDPSRRGTDMRRD